MKLSNNLTDIILLCSSIAYVFFIICLGFFLLKKCKIEVEYCRKIIHIGVSPWCFFLSKFSNIWLALLGPFLFCFLNGYFVLSKKNVNIGIGNNKRDLGIVYLPISYFFLTLLLFIKVIDSRVFYAGFLSVGISDGLAGAIGTKFGKHSFHFFSKSNKKSIEGSLSFFTSCLIILLLLKYTLSFSATVSALLTIIEALCCFGLDNIVVPFSFVLISILFSL